MRFRGHYLVQRGPMRRTGSAVEAFEPAKCYRPRARSCRWRLLVRSGIVPRVVGTPKVQGDAGGGLAAALEAGDNALAIEILLIQHGDEIYGYCRRLLGNAVEAEDVSQTVFAQAFQNLEDLSSAHTARLWLRGIARHRCLDRLRARRRNLEVVDHKALCAIVDRELAVVSADSDPRVSKALAECLDCLDARSREVLVLRFQDGLSFEEIGKLTQDTPGALRVRLSRALPALRRCLEGKGVQP
jgi:RNA polymerase sigma factor (sigma-70 family)